MEHSHNHHHTIELSAVNQAFIIGIILNISFVLVEALAGFWTNSLALLADAGHNLSDVASLILSLLSFRLAKIKHTSGFTYGYRKATILASLANAFILLMAIGGIAYETVLRIQRPMPVPGLTISLVATVGIFINSISAFLFLKDKEKDLNVKGAYLHLLADALVSLGVVIAGILIYYTQWLWLDSLISFSIVLVILYSTWSLLTDSLRLTLDGIPSGINLNEIKQAVIRIEGVKDIHHLHIWAISTTQNALTTHVIVNQNGLLNEFIQLKNKIKHELEHLNIQHCTLELEIEAEDCEENCE